ncbi:hypothetical protein, variant 2 [Aphanomyces astaci]|uniref:WW domain-containing protein n=2 Tax=Aphanomyces astaci TaxID=112090 RepID=W4FGY8_APHAT|nr:hypothetical protein, variant 1 [Aphanomyces astaci]XP_009843843.1 hypothetical protein, variant 2 [Aphanomyces astaci]ETV66714.1 hypothetical protein, variant 1 [Aphanomyces astaci]ETV66715.1 hypothetical protein, variant 2 [Aphanomyces astaci]|eukprot:XP_009843838.1 hypothetical protein, variant 1 [Aphanomyces astaci]
MKRGRPGADDDAVPDGWIVRMSASKNKPYYIHVSTNKTQWHHPNSDKPQKKSKPFGGAEVADATTVAVTRAFRVGGTNVSSKSASLCLFQPWPHQVRAVARVVAAIATHSNNPVASSGATPSNFLIQHSTGSGKSYTIACLAYQLLYTRDIAGRGFHTVIILVDRIKLDQQLGDTVESFLHRNGIESVFRAETIEHLSTVVGMPANAQKVIVTTTHKLALLVQDKVLLARLLASSSGASLGNITHVAIIADEVHRSHTSGTRDSISTVLDALHHKTYYIGFSATPSVHTLRMFGHRDDRTSSLRPFDCHSIAQAVDAHHIVNVLEHFTSLTCTYSVAQSTENNVGISHKDNLPWLQMQLASSHPAILAAKASSMMQHFVQTCKTTQVFAKCLVVARNRKDVVTYHRLLTAFMTHQNLPGRVYCTFSPFDNVHENQFNTCTLPQADVIVVCDKLDTGYNEPALVAMYIDRPLVAYGRIVQLLSRLNRCREGKSRVFVRDYANHPAHIRRAFDEFAHESSESSSSQPDLTKVALDLKTASVVLWTTLPGLLLDGDGRRHDALVDVADVAAAVHRCHMDTYLQIKHALAMYLDASAVLHRESPYLPRLCVDSSSTPPCLCLLC